MTSRSIPKSFAVCLATALIIVLAGCGGGVAGSITPKATSKQPTMAAVCASHEGDIGNIAAGLLVFKTAMETQDTSLLTPGMAEKVTRAVSDLQSAAVGATSANLPVMRRFLALLQDVSDSYTSPPTHPSAFIGDQDVAEVEHAGEQVGCRI